MGAAQPTREPCRIDLIVGTRPNLVKVAPLHAELSGAHWCDSRIVSLEQHTHQSMGIAQLGALRIDARDVERLQATGDGFGNRLGGMIDAYARHASQRKPDLAVVFGDVDATLAGAIASKRSGLELAHVEAGLRSHDRGMPEELNRILVDSVSDLSFTTTEEASCNLLSEGKTPDQIHFVGNLMIDSLKRYLSPEPGGRLLHEHGLDARGFAVATFHRPSNVDGSHALEQVCSALRELSSTLPVVLPLHPRTAASLERHGLRDRLDDIAGLHLLPPLPYLEFVSLCSLARLVVTDSGGIQEETSILGIPCITARENTERVITVSMGTNRLSPVSAIAAHARRILDTPMPSPASIPMWDGHASERIAALLSAWWRA